jgi:hypothetical protein
MSKAILFNILFFIIINSIDAQNVGIGTTTPTEKLEVKNTGTSTIKISSGSLSDTSQLILSNRSAGQGTDFLIKNIREQGMFIASQSDLPANNSANSLVISPIGNVGVGILPAASNKLHVNGTSNFNGLLKIETTNILEFGAGIAGKEVNAGKIGYNAFGQNALTIVGAGTNTNNRKIFMFAEGGTTLSGPLNLLSSIQLNSNQGTAGQVLTSNGAGTPLWTNSAFGNQVRFAAYYNCPNAAFGVNTVTNTTIYNQSPADITIGENSITINKSGLYHIQGFARFRIDYTSSQSDIPYANLSIGMGGNSFIFAETEPMGYKSASNFLKSVPFSQDYYFTAPSTLSINTIIGTGSLNYTTRASSGIITGYLISE